VTQASANERQGGDRESGRTGRWISRALLVLGGIAAGTVAAWAVSGASASAATISTDAVTTAATGSTVDATPVTDATVSGLNDVTHGVSGLAGDTAGAVSAALRDTACHQDATTWSAAEQLHPLPAWCAQLDRDEVGGPLRTHGKHRSVSDALSQDVAGRVSDAVDNFTDTAVTHPVKTTLGAVERIVTKPQDVGQVLGETFAPSANDGQGLGQKVWDWLNPANGSGTLPGDGSGKAGAPVQGTTPAADSTSVPPSVTLASLAPGAGRSAARTESSTLDGSTGGHHDFPAPYAPVQFPTAPLSTPSAPGGGSASGGHFDGSTFGVPAWSSAAFGNALAGIVRAGVRYMPLTPGSQPGVTPD
jgi:hypothetical protein